MRRKILTKIARKHFPHGFGPATGDNFVVEEIGAVDDDEEEWGDYQLDRNGIERNVYDGDQIDEGHGVGKYSNKRDEFQRARYENPKF